MLLLCDAVGNPGRRSEDKRGCTCHVHGIALQPVCAPYLPPFSGHRCAGAPPQAAPAWTNSYPTDQQLAYTLALEQAGGAPPRQKLACGGLGEQWSLFLIGIFLWPLW